MIKLYNKKIYLEYSKILRNETKDTRKLCTSIRSTQVSENYPYVSSSTSTILVFHIFHAYFIRNEIVLHFWVKSFSQFRSQPVVFTGFTRCNNKTGGGKGQGEA